jgi:membrane fusion protein (multidrug efflux system)
MDNQTHPTLVGLNDEPAKRGGRARTIVMIVLLGGLVLAGTLYWLDASHYVSTDDAFIDGNVSQVSAQISGRIMRLLVNDNQRVGGGQLLAEIDPRDAQAQVTKLQAQRDEAEAQVIQARAALPARAADVAQDEANVRVQEAQLRQSRSDLARYTRINPRAITAQIIDQARASADAATAHLDGARSALAGARAQLAMARAQVATAEASLRSAAANLAEAELQLSYTRIVAPATGTIARRTVDLGNYVVPGQALMAVVQPECWVTANLKESQLTYLRTGQTATIQVDAFPDEKLTAHVDSVQSGTGAVFSSLPAENATGNYVKVVQRIPVKLIFDGDPCARLHLAQGMSVVPRIKVR